jgi:hypothetical protein
MNEDKIRDFVSQRVVTLVEDFIETNCVWNHQRNVSSMKDNYWWTFPWVSHGYSSKIGFEFLETPNTLRFYIHNIYGVRTNCFIWEYPDRIADIIGTPRFNFVNGSLMRDLFEYINQLMLKTNIREEYNGFLASIHYEEQPKMNPRHRYGMASKNNKEENNMSETNNCITYGIDKIGEAVERWLEWQGFKSITCSKDPSLYTWRLHDDRVVISLQKFTHGYVISSITGAFSGIRSNLVKITPPFRVDIIQPEISGSSLERLVYELKEIPNKQSTQQTKKKPEDDFILKGAAPSIVVKNITYNTVKGTTTVVFDDNTKVMTTTTEGEEFNPEIGLAMCIAKKLYGSRTNFKRVVKLAMDKSARGNKKRAEKQKKKAEKEAAQIEHAKAQAESYME